MQDKLEIRLLGTRGIPAQHGGFETFIEKLAPFLADKGWSVTVYCQKQGRHQIKHEMYENVELVHIHVPGTGVLSTIRFDWISMLHALKYDGLLVSFGYPTGLFAILPRLAKRKHIINMDGIEWKRSQFGVLGRLSYYVNERIAALSANVLIADHPEIKTHLSTRVNKNKITMIPYGGDEPDKAIESVLSEFGVDVDQFAVVIARPEPDNSILEIVRSFSMQKRNKILLVLGDFIPHNPYHKKVLEAASNEVHFIGAIYDKKITQSLRKYSRFYIHGHRVGGTNPSLVEALAAGSATVAHKNKFNEWVAKDSAVYFSTEEDLNVMISQLFNDDDLIQKMRKNANKRFLMSFRWNKILHCYQQLFEDVFLERLR